MHFRCSRGAILWRCSSGKMHFRCSRGAILWRCSSGKMHFRCSRGEIPWRCSRGEIQETYSRESLHHHRGGLAKEMGMPYFSKEVQLTKKHEEILAQRLQLLQEMEDRNNQKAEKKAAHLKSANLAFKRNQSLLNIASPLPVVLGATTPSGLHSMARADCPLSTSRRWDPRIISSWEGSKRGSRRLSRRV
ncbi:centrosomal protein 15 isoform X2 [Macrotis lagotis]|uniref:centrosomal protein 15 isoform X2 n=1 Tax=Macrotis lagotis TaxID=92651 RepID=UPI003D69BC6D